MGLHKYLIFTCAILITINSACKKDEEPTDPPEEEVIVYEDNHEFSRTLVAGSGSHFSPNSDFFYFEVTSSATDIQITLDIDVDPGTSTDLTFDVELASLANDTVVDILEEFNEQNISLLFEQAPQGEYAVKVFGNAEGVEHDYTLKVSGNGLSYNGEREKDSVSFSGNWFPWGSGLGNFVTAARDPYFEIAPKMDNYFYEVRVDTDNGVDAIFRQSQGIDQPLYANLTMETGQSYDYYRPLTFNSIDFTAPLGVHLIGQQNQQSNYTITFYYWVDDPLVVTNKTIESYTLTDTWAMGGGTDADDLANPNYEFELNITEPVWANFILKMDMPEYEDTTYIDYHLYEGAPGNRVQLRNLQEYNDILGHPPTNVFEVVGEIYTVQLSQSGTYSLAFLADTLITNQDFEFYMIVQGDNYTLSEPVKLW